MYAEEYLVDRIKKLEDENAFLNRQKEIISDSLKNEREHSLNEHNMLLFIWDEVIDSYNPDKCVIHAGGNTIDVPGRLQDFFKLWQSFKDNPEGGGV